MLVSSSAGELSGVRAPLSRAWLLGFGLWSILLSGWFFVDSASADLSALSGDQINILTVAAKKDYPHLLNRDLVVGNPADTAYYIPIFVDTIRLLSLPDHDYLRGLNIFLFFTSLLYVWGWWLLFSVWGDRWTAAILAFFVRGVLWPPGNELWGIAGLWTMLPRTLFIGALPWVMWIWMRYRSTVWGWPATAFACGAIVNIHPISGACVAAALLLSETAWSLREGRRLGEVILRCASGSLFVLAGASPFLITFWLTIGKLGPVDPLEFEHAIRMRLSPVFLDIGLYVRGWLHPKWIALIFGPWVAYLFVAKQLSRSERHAVFALAVFAVSCMAFALAPVLLEEALRQYGHTPRFGFQLVRTGKYVLVPSLVLTALAAAMLWRSMSNRVRPTRAVLVAVTCVVAAVTLASRSPVFDDVPMIGDELVRQLWPPSKGPTTEADIEQLTALMGWIRENTPTEAGFIGPRLIRVGALRSVIHDFSGAVMLIEGNPQAYVATARRQEEFRRAEQQGSLAQAKLFASWGADYWVTRDVAPELALAYGNSRWFVYDLNGSRAMLTGLRDH